MYSEGIQVHCLAKWIIIIFLLNLAKFEIELDKEKF